MAGVPVLLVSLSRTNLDTGKLMPVGTWSPEWKQRAVEIMRQVVSGLGDPKRERHFRMNATICLHRALTEQEIEQLPAFFHSEAALDSAGGPVEILWENVPGELSTRPCKRPGREQLDSDVPALWIPVDCGVCPSCTARQRVEEEAERKANGR
jgi:hypothetical protein